MLHSRPLHSQRASMSVGSLIIISSVLLFLNSSLILVTAIPANSNKVNKHNNIESSVEYTTEYTSQSDATSQKQENNIINDEKWVHDEDHSEYVSYLDSTNKSAAKLYDEKYKNLAEKEWQLMFRSFDIMYEGVSSSFVNEFGQIDLMRDIEQQLPDDCRQSLAFMRQSLKKHKLWALRMVDSMGKIQSGITYGKFSSPGDYEECINVKVDEQWINPELVIPAGGLNNNPKKKLAQSRQNWKGKYCLLDFRLPLPERPKNKLLGIHNPVLNLSNTEIAKQFPAIANYSGYASVFYEIGYLHGICLPSTCEIEDVTKAVGKVLEGLYIIVNNTIDCEVLRETIEVRPSQWIAIVFFLVLFVNAILASVLYYNYQIYKKESSARSIQTNKGNYETDITYSDSYLIRLAKKHHAYSECFSLQTNFYRLTKPDPRSLTFVHYTRIVAMALTVITHTAGMGTLQAITKPADATNSDQIFRDFIPQMLANAFTSIQIFFFMAGFMLVLSTYPSVKREKGKISFLEYAIKRAIRLMPGIAATIGVNFLWPLMVDGPMLTYFVKMIMIPCETNWWHSLLFLSNYDHVEKMCLRHSYFSASDYQLHMIAFPVLILLYHKPTAALMLAGLLTLSGFVAQVIMISTKTALPFMMVDYIDKEAFFNVVHYIHHPAWNHISAFFAGFIIGYFVIKQYRWNISQRTIKILWCVILPAGLAAIYAPYYWNHYKRPIYKWQMVLYLIIDRAVLLITCAWLSYGSMVLSRKKPTKSDNKKQAEPHTAESRQEATGVQSTTIALAKQSMLNLPTTVSMINISTKDNTKNIENQKQSNNSDNDTRLRTNSQTGQLNKNTIQLGGHISAQSVSSSTPNLSDIKSDKNTDNSSQKTSHDSQQVNSSPAAASKRPITSTLNTLCLVLSRLTFQLYLFNMVVLWFDVNHSKYLWYFSYYFIIVKAFAVYIASAIFATVFFVTLESPCLTLYIIWVKYRAQKRGEKEELHQEVAKDLNEANKKIESSFASMYPPADKKSISLQAPSIKVNQQLIKSDSKDHLSEPNQSCLPGRGYKGIYHINSSNSIHSMAVTPIMQHDRRQADHDKVGDINRV